MDVTMAAENCDEAIQILSHKGCQAIAYSAKGLKQEIPARPCFSQEKDAGVVVEWDSGR